VRITAIVVGLAIALTGCSIKRTPPTQEEVTVHNNLVTSRAACYAAQGVSSAELWKALSAIPKEDRALAILMVQQSEAGKALLAVATGRTYDPCGGGTNIFDVEIAEMEATAEMYGSYLDTAKWGLGLGLGYLAVDSIMDAVSGSVVNYAVSENGKVNVNSQNSGSMNAVTGDFINEGSNNPVNNSYDNIDNDSDDGIDTGIMSTDPVDPEFTEQQCIDNPPAGYSDAGTPLFSPGCSCNSHARGNC